jgi:hypothetical protein
MRYVFVKKTAETICGRCFRGEGKKNKIKEKACGNYKIYHLRETKKL